MDPRSDVTPVPPVNPAGPQASTMLPTAQCEQAIFTSVATPMGSGYRLVAASRGLRPDEKKQITVRSPSHDSLCDPGPTAAGVSFYPLDSGRLCIAYTCCAGLEGTGRGGERIYTRALVLDAAGFGRFGYNAFDVVRSLVASGQAEPELKPPAELPVLELPVQCGPQTEELWGTLAQVGGDWLGCVLEYALDHQPVVIVGPFSSPALVEVVLLSMPGPLRMQMSFGAGLRFSLSRKFDLNALDGDAVQLGHLLLGHGLELLAPKSGRQPPQGRTCAWLQMARRRWHDNRWAELASLTGRDYPDCSNETLQRYARLCNTHDDLCSFDAPALIDVLDDNLGPAPQDELEAELTIELVRDALSQLSDHLSTASLEELTRRWPTIVNLWRRSASATGLLSALVGKLLKRMTRLAPLEAAAKAASAIPPALQANGDTAAVQQALHDLLDHLAEWLHDALVGDVEKLPQLLNNWPFSNSLADRLQDLRTLINDRLASVKA
ncbi:MAG: GAP1-N2 domain-containing protein [Planctomycetota bacterium]